MIVRSLVLTQYQRVTDRQTDGRTQHSLPVCALHSYATLPCTTSSSAVVKRLRDALCPSVVTFNSVIHRAQSFIIATQPASDLSLRNVVSSVTLRLLVIHFVVVSHHQQTRSLITTSVINSPWSVTAKCIATQLNSTQSLFANNKKYRKTQQYKTRWQVAREA